MRKLAALALVFLIGCSSAKKNIVESATQVKTDSTKIQTNLTGYLEIHDSFLPELPPLFAEEIWRVEESLALAKSIDTQADKVLQNSAGVENSQNPWIRPLIWISAAVCFVVFMVIGFQTGLFGVIGAFIGLGTTLIPKAVKTRVKFDQEALEENPSDPLLREKIAIERTRSPVYDKTFKVEKKKTKKSK